MSATGLEVFDTTLQKTNGWLKEVMDLIGSQDRQRAYLALRSTLHALRDRLAVEEAAQLGAQLPMLIRGFYYEGWHPSDTPVKVRSKSQFLGRIAQELTDDLEPEQVVRAVLTVLSRRVTEGEIRDVQQALPEEIRELWH
jgi:uncharacterized protein (DUF2267 family)